MAVKDEGASLFACRPASGETIRTQSNTAQGRENECGSSGTEPVARQSALYMGAWMDHDGITIHNNNTCRQFISAGLQYYMSRLRYTISTQWEGRRGGADAAAEPDERADGMPKQEWR